MSQIAFELHLRRALVALADAREALSQYARRGELGDLGGELAVTINGAQQLIAVAEQEWREWNAAQWRRIRMDLELSRAGVAR